MRLVFYKRFILEESKRVKNVVNENEKMYLTFELDLALDKRSPGSKIG